MVLRAKVRGWRPLPTPCSLITTGTTCPDKSEIMEMKRRKRLSLEVLKHNINEGDGGGHAIRDN